MRKLFHATAILLFAQSLSCEKKLDVKATLPSTAAPATTGESSSQEAEANPVVQTDSSAANSNSESTVAADDKTAEQLPPMPSQTPTPQPSPDPTPTTSPTPTMPPLPPSPPDPRVVKVKAVNLLAGDGCVMSAGASDNPARKEECWADLTIQDRDYRFYFHLPSSPSVDDIGFAYTCAGMKYPAMPWPSNCQISFSGPSIDNSPVPIRRDEFGQVTCSSSGCPQPIELSKVMITPSSDACFGSSSPATSACYAIIKIGGIETRFSFFVPTSPDFDSMGFTYSCANTDFPTKPIADGCKLSFNGPSVKEICPEGSQFPSSYACTKDGCKCESRF